MPRNWCGLTLAIGLLLAGAGCAIEPKHPPTEHPLGVPTEARLVRRGLGKPSPTLTQAIGHRTLVYRPKNDGTIWIVEPILLRPVFSANVKLGDRIEADIKTNTITLNDRQIIYDFKSGSEYYIYFADHNPTTLPAGP